jgi:hypothetical protein
MITPKIKGWANFFRHSAAKQTFSRLDNKVFKLLWKWANDDIPTKATIGLKPNTLKTKATDAGYFRQLIK